MSTDFWIVPLCHYYDRVKLITMPSEMCVVVAVEKLRKIIESRHV